MPEQKIKKICKDKLREDISRDLKIINGKWENINKEFDKQNKAADTEDTNNEWPDDVAFSKHMEQGDINFFNRYFTNKIEKLEWNGKDEMSLNIIFSSFDCGMRLGYTWRDIVEEPLRKFKERAKEIGDEEFNPLPALVKRWNEEGFV